MAQMEVSNACSVIAAHLNIRLFLIAQGPSVNKLLQFTGKASNDTLCCAYSNTGKAIFVVIPCMLSSHSIILPTTALI